MQVNWNGLPRPTMFVSSGQLTAAMSGNDVASQGVAQRHCGHPGRRRIQGEHVQHRRHAPSISSLSPNLATAGVPGFTLTVNGANFDANSGSRYWNGQAQTTTFVSSSQLTIAVPTGLLATPGSAGITVATPDNVISNTGAFTVSARSVVTSLSPNAVIAGHAGFTLTVSGTNFVNGTTVQWNGQPRSTVYVSATQLTVPIAPSDVMTQGTAQVGVVSADIGVEYAALHRQAHAARDGDLAGEPPPGFGGFTLSVTGANFAPGYSLLWNGQARTTTVINGATLTAAIPATDVVSAGTAAVSVLSTEGVALNAATFSIDAAPLLADLSPAFVTATAPAFTLTVNGGNFNAGSTVRWDGTLSQPRRSMRIASRRPSPRTSSRSPAPQPSPSSAMTASRPRRSPSSSRPPHPSPASIPARSPRATPRSR